MSQIFHLQRSSFLARFFILIVFGAIVSVIFSHIYFFVKIFLLFFIMWYFSKVGKKYIWLTDQKSIVQLIFQTTGEWRLVDRSGHFLEIKWHGESVITPFFLFLMSDHPRRRLLVSRQSLPIEQFRALLVAVKQESR